MKKKINSKERLNGVKKERKKCALGINFQVVVPKKIFTFLQNIKSINHVFNKKTFFIRFYGYRGG